MSRFPPHQSGHSFCSQTLSSFIVSTPVSFQLCDKPLLFSNLWDLSHWPRQTGYGERERMPNRVVTSNTCVPALLPSTTSFGRNFKLIGNSALLWQGKILQPKLLLSHVASSNLHPKYTFTHFLQAVMEHLVGKMYLDCRYSQHLQRSEENRAHFGTNDNFFCDANYVKNKYKMEHCRGNTSFREKKSIILC